MAAQDLKGKVMIVTGSSAGIGVETVRTLAARGARVIMACRTESKTMPIREQIIHETGNQEVVFMKLDLASMASVRAFAEIFNEGESRLDVLINNAGTHTSVWPDKRQVTHDGFEMMFGTNHLGHFLLTYLLWDKLISSAPSRIVNVSSLAHRPHRVDFDDLQMEKKFNDAKAYGRSKSANILFTVHLAKLLEGTGVTTYCLHPGIIKSDLLHEKVKTDNACTWCCIACCMRCCLGRRLLNVKEGSYTTIYCATEPNIATQSGRYYENCGIGRARRHATDPESAKRLWHMSMDLCRL